MVFVEEDTVQDLSATQQAYIALRQMILIGTLAPDEKLKIKNLGTLLNIGASPIREALSLLTSDQLVVRHDQKGFRTADVSPENFQEILRLRCSLEEMALRESIASSNQDWEEKLVLAHHRMVRSKKDNSEEFEARHKVFHMILIGNCASPVLQRFCDQLYDLNIRYRYIAGRSDAYVGRNVDGEHLNILNAAIEGAADEASELLLMHYRETGAFLAAHI